MRIHLTILACFGLSVGAPQAQEDGLALWDKIHEVFSHPRCANCHVDDGVPLWSGPSYGDTRAHGMFVGGDPEEPLGLPGQRCTTCHMAENSTVPHGPPGAEVWFLPPPEFVWTGRTSAEICAQIKDPERNGDRTIAEVADHITHDALVLWGWDPGPGREPAPHSPSEIEAALLAWDAVGAPCPE